MLISKTLVRLPLLLVLVMGCAPAYHSYSSGCVNCKYCAPPPLPYAPYEGCVCHSCAASKYLTNQLPAVQQESDAAPIKD